MATTIRATILAIVLLCSCIVATGQDQAPPERARGEDTAELKKQIASLSSKVTNFESLIARAGTLQVEFEAARDERDRLAREKDAIQQELTAAQQDLAAAKHALQAEQDKVKAKQDALKAAQDAAAAAAETHAKEHKSLGNKVSSLEAMLAPLQAKAARLHVVEKELDRTKLALEELQQAHDALVADYAVLRHRAARPLSVNLTALIPKALLDKGDEALAPLLAPVMPALHGAWTGAHELMHKAWAGCQAAWQQHAPTVAASVHTAVQVSGRHAAMAIAAARAYVHESKLDERAHALLEDLKALLAASMAPYPSLEALSREPTLSYVLYLLLALPVALVSLPLLSCCCTRRKRPSKPKQQRAAAPPRPTPRKTRASRAAATPLSDDGMSADEMTFVKGRRQPQGAPTSPPPGAVVRTPGTSVRARGASVRVA